MKQTQQRFWPDDRPLVERLGRDFFRSLPERPGVYLMRGATETVLYVGKAKNLRRRLGSYRVANPERMARRQLRLLHLVVRIELQECDDEQAALRREAELLRTLKPRFNRAGTWQGKPRFLAWKIAGSSVELTFTEAPESDWNHGRPMGGGAVVLRGALARLLWMAMHPQSGLAGLPMGWFRGSRQKKISIPCGPMIELLAPHLKRAMTGDAAPFCDWIRARLPSELHPFEKSVLECDLESVADLLAAREETRSVKGQPAAAAR